MSQTKTIQSNPLEVNRCFWKAYAARDKQTVLAMCSPNLTSFGTGTHERANTLEEFQQLFSADLAELPDPYKLELRWERSSCYDTTAVVECELVIDIVSAADPVRLPPVRITSVLERKGDSWVFLHIHGSFPSSEQAQGESYPMDALRARTEELELRVAERTNELRQKSDQLEQALAQLKAAQGQLIVSEKMASLGQLTAGIAHEIKNPLNFVNNFATLSGELAAEIRDELAKLKPAADPKIIGFIEDILNDLEQNVTKINEHGKRADSIVKGMLLHSRGKAGEHQPTDINALLEEYVNLAYHGLRAQDPSFNVKIEASYDRSIGSIDVVPQDLSRVFLNIVNNGCYAANDRRKSEGEGFMPTIRITTKDCPGHVEIRIRDNGKGIPPEVLEKMFHPFFTTKPTGVGTGLGLSLSYDIVVQMHKGDLRVETAEGEFAEFIITLPKSIK